MSTKSVSRYASSRPAGAFDLMDKIRLNTLVDRFPLSWRAVLVKQLGKWSPSTRDAWAEAVDKLTDAARAGVRLDANDADLCDAAKTTAADFARRIGHERVAATGSAAFFARYGRRWVERCVWGHIVRLMERRGLLDLLPIPEKYEGKKGLTVEAVVLRLQCEKFWRRALRTLHARTVEACNVKLGRVSRAAGLYASDDAVTRRIGQNARNAAVMESVTAVNDLGQVAKLSDLAAKGTSNKAIRRVELLTRIAGFEEIAKGLGHSACMVTMTCPSRFHAMTTREGKTFPNKKYDGSTPIDASRFLTSAWARFRAAAGRLGLGAYGFRISEPQHDATPHWHCILFFPALVDKTGETGQAALERLVRTYFLDADNPNEPGAQEHRVDFERIDWARGSAVGYVIKYVSKNIDGFGVGLDLEGQCAAMSSARVEAWASTWRVRQFQQVGGPPVGVWRELRRINPDAMPEGIPDALRVAVSAVNSSKVEPGVAAIAWMRYATAQGGIHCSRSKLALRLLREDRGHWAKTGRYGERAAPRVIGVDAAGVQLFRNHIHVLRPDLPAFERKTFAGIESERCEWVVTHGTREQAERAARVVFERSGEAASTRIHVNNCTDRARGTVSEFAATRVYRPRLRRFKVREPVRPREVSNPKEENPHGTYRELNAYRAGRSDDDSNPY